MKLTDKKIIKALEDGKKIQRKEYEKFGSFFILDEDGSSILTQMNVDLILASFEIDDLIANDWQIMKENKK